MTLVSPLPTLPPLLLRSRPAATLKRLTRLRSCSSLQVLCWSAADVAVALARPLDLLG
tara:strand:- start:1122 stop:1295 length:174 start_codon:yes stop_codon:yes gene_type:complete